MSARHPRNAKNKGSDKADGTIRPAGAAPFMMVLPMLGVFSSCAALPRALPWAVRLLALQADSVPSAMSFPKIIKSYYWE